MPQNRWGKDGAGHTSRSSGLLRLEASQRVVHVTSSRRSREDEVEDGWVDAMSYIRLFYSNFTVFIVLGPMGILVFWLSL
jgi:hypothetical protein